METENKLNRTFGFWSAISMVIGTVIGSGIFFKQGRVLAEAGSSTNAILAWIVSGFIALAGALTISELASRVPKTGGLYTYIEAPFGRAIAFLAGWMQVIFYGPAMIAAVAYFFGTLLLNLLGIPQDHKILGLSTGLLTGLATILFIAAINLFDNNVSRRFNIVTTLIKFIPVAGLIFYGLFFGRADALGQTVNHIANSTASSGFGVAMLSTLFAYDGWVIASALGGEVKNSSKTLPKALAIGMTFVLIVYTAVTWGVLKSLPAQDLVHLDTQAPYYIATKAFGDIAGKLMAVFILVSVIGTMNSKVLGFPRIVYEMAVENNFPFAKQFSKLGQKTKTPYVAVIFIAVMAIVMLFLAGAQDLSDWAILLTYIFYTVAFVGLFVLRKKHIGDDSEYRVPLFPVVPIVAIAGSIFIITSTLVAAVQGAANKDATQLIGIIISVVVVLLGYPVYKYLEHKNGQSN
ncbi:MAG: APC family permease [Lactobacillaceae bacterium]|jgi:APA family basic amino acid/polyamine antiporter|nr:APC family permease [Lactobacillaceae bacterium]